MTDFNVSIANSGDDYTTWPSGSFWDTYDYIIIGFASGRAYRTGLIFRNVTIPQGSEIVSAFVRLTADGATAVNTVNLSVHCENADTATIPTDSAGEYAITLTTGVDWDSVSAFVDGVTYDTPDFAADLQVVVNRGGWASGQNIGVHIDDNGSSSTAYRQASSQEHAGSEQAVLYVTYAVAVGVADEFSVDDSVDAFSLTDGVSDQFSISDAVNASGGSTSVDVSDNLTSDDSVSVILEFDGLVSDGVSVDDLIVVGLEYQAPVADEFVISDLSDCFLWSEWLRENYGKYRIKYYFTLTGDADNESDQELPFSSFQARKRNGEATFLSVIVPVLSYSSAITARSNGDLKIDMAYIVGGVEDFRENILTVDLENIRIDEGPRRGSITLSGSRVFGYGSNLITLENPIYKYVSDGKIRYRFLQADPWLNPGDVVRWRTDEFVVEYITYSISDRFKQMEVSEA